MLETLFKALFSLEEEEDDDKDVKLDAWMWWTIAFGCVVGGVVTFFVVRAVGNLLAVANLF